MNTVSLGIVNRTRRTSKKENSSILLDADVKCEFQQKVIDAIETDADNRVTDIHVWKVGPQHLAVLLTIVTHYSRPSSEDTKRKARVYFL